MLKDATVFLLWLPSFYIVHLGLQVIKQKEVFMKAVNSWKRPVSFA